MWHCVFGMKDVARQCPSNRTHIVVGCNILRTEHIVPHCRSPDPNQLQYQDTIPHAVNLSLTLLKMGKSCPKPIGLILEISKSLLLHLVGLSI